MSLVLFPEKHHADVLALKNAKDVPGLIRYLNHRNSEIQWQAADALGTLGSDAVVPLIYVLDNGYKSVRIGAIEALGAIRDPRSVRPLAHLLKHDPAIEVRWIAALALGEIGDSTAIPPLVESLRDKERYVRYGAARSLELLHWIPRDDTEKAYYAIALQNWPVVKNIGKSATGPLADIFRDPDPATRVKIVNCSARSVIRMHNPLVKRHSGTLILLSGGQPLWQQKNARYDRPIFPGGLPNANGPDRTRGRLRS